jgi:hypothetical protein
VIVDIVTARKESLHCQLVARLSAQAMHTATGELSAASYRPVERDHEPSLDIWHETLVLGQPLVTMPMWLRGGLCLPVDLEATYNRTCTEQRIPIG